jgi:hypothetical protein
MAVAPDTTTGTITLTSGSANFTTSGTNMLTRGHLPGDEIFRLGFVLVIATISGENAGTLTDNCPAAAAGTGPVRIRYQPDGSRVPAQARNLIDAIGDMVTRVIAATATVAAKIILAEGTNNGAHKATIKPPDAMAADRTFTTPDADVTMHAFSAQYLDDPNGAAVLATLLNGNALTVGTGIVAQFATQISILETGHVTSVRAGIAFGNGFAVLQDVNGAGVRDFTIYSALLGSVLTINPSGQISLLYGQLAMPASQNASAGANVWDDYEEGMHTASASFGGASVGITGTFNGFYVKNARVVTGTHNIIFTSKGSSVGTLGIAGLPFTSMSGPTALANVGFAANMTGLTGALRAHVASNGTNINLVQSTATGDALLANTVFTNTSQVYPAFSYLSAA